MTQFLRLFLRMAPVFFALSLSGSPVITEFMAQNRATLADEDGDFSDWIEIHNPTGQPVNLAGWHLTDRADDPTMWTFPPAILEPGAFLVVFASNKDRAFSGAELHTNFALAAAGEYLALIAPNGITRATEFAPVFPPQLADVSYGRAMAGDWVRLVGKSDPVRVHVPTESTGPALGEAWRERVFDDSGWLPGTLAVGFKVGASDPLEMRSIFETDLQAPMYNLPNRLSAYLRIPFNVPAPAAILALEARTEYDDGYALFLNGGATPVDAANAPVGLTWLSGATEIEYDHNGLSLRVADLSAHLDRLVAGENILALHGLNANQGSSDFLAAPQLWARVASASGPAVYGYFQNPTPGRANPGLEAFSLSETVEFSEPPRTFTGSLMVALASSGEPLDIRYTTNGSRPSSESPLYTAPLVLTQTTYLRARVFDENGLGGPVSGRHFLRLASGLVNRQSNLPMVVLDPRAQALNASTRRPALFLLFDRDEQGVSALNRPPDLSTRQGLRWRGSSSLDQPKRPYSVEFWDEEDEEVRHPLLGMTEESDWVLYAPYDFDRAYIRNSVAYELSRRIGRWAPQTRFVEVFLNANGGDLTTGDYAGVYAIIEQVKMNARRLGFRTVDPVDTPPPGPIDLSAQGSWTGGYLFKIDRTDPDEYDWRTNRGIPTGFALTVSRPKMRNLDGGPYFSNRAAFEGSGQIRYLRTYVQAFEDALYADAASGFLTRSHLDWIDRDTFVDHLIVNAFTKNVDALRLSAFFHKPQDQPLMAGPVWDFDRSMGSYDPRDDEFNTWNASQGATRFFGQDWWGVLAADPDFRQAFYDRWAELRQGAYAPVGLSDVILPMGAEINNSSGGLGSAAQRDAARWFANSPRAGGYPAEINHLHNWMQNRANWMDRRRTDGGLLPIPPVAAFIPSGTGGSVTLSAPGGGTIYFTINGSDPRASGGRVGGEAYDGPFTVGNPTEVTARVRDGAGHWSTPTLLSLTDEDRGPVFLPVGTAAWNADAHWDSSPAPYPDGAMRTATIPPPGGEVNRAVVLDSSVTVGGLYFPQGPSATRNRLSSAHAGASLTFNNAGAPARLVVEGTGSGFVEFDLAGPVILQDDLLVDVQNIAGAADFGALRLRRGWQGPGGLIKRGPGIASLTGGDKDFTGAVRIEEGVLQVTGPAAPVSSSGIRVFDGGQLRLNSEGNPRFYTFGNLLQLAGDGRGAAIPDGANQGKRGALRYEPGTQGNRAVISSPIAVAFGAGLHVAGAENTLEIVGAISGAGFLKSGGGTLILSGSAGGLGGTVSVETGVLDWRTESPASVHIGKDTRFIGDGRVGALAGAGELLVDGADLAANSVSGLHHRFIFREGAEATLLTESILGPPASIRVFLDQPADQPAAGNFLGAYWMPGNALSSAIESFPTIEVFVRAVTGPVEFLGERWEPTSEARATVVPQSRSFHGTATSGETLSIRVGSLPATFAEWRALHFSPAEAADPAISGPEAAPFGDGVPNLLRFALGVPDLSPDPAPRLPRMHASLGSMALHYWMRPEIEDLVYQIQRSGNLVTWETVFDSRFNAPIPVAGEEGRYSLPASLSAPGFFRMSVFPRP